MADSSPGVRLGVAGGEDGEPGADKLVREESVEALPAKCTRTLEVGDRVSIRTPGGGGYGDPADRDREAIERDLRSGKITPEAARERYGIDPADVAERGDADRR